MIPGSSTCRRNRPPRSGVSRFPRVLVRNSLGSGLCLVSYLDPDTRHYPDRDAKERLNNSSSMPEIPVRSQSAAARGPPGHAGVAELTQRGFPLIAFGNPQMDDKDMTV